MAGFSGVSPIINKAIWNYSKYLLVALINLFLLPGVNDLDAQAADPNIFIGEDGIMRWSSDGIELTGFGVNYTAPFAHAFRSARKLGIDLKSAIDQDVLHFKRLGLDLYRVHVWDCEISDSLGNLIDNEHLELFDYLLLRLKENGINAIITPIAYWGNGWPDADEVTPGFSSKYGKDNCLVDPAAIAAQETYLAQFVSHVNRYTGEAYKDTRSVLAFEISNEPHHRGSPGQVTAFVGKMKNAIRSTGCTKPVFYNVTHSVHLAEAYFKAGIDGGTFQWYPTGLGFRKEIGGNMLPNVDQYEIPFEDVLKKNGAARIVYEFDAADMASTYIYPAMARSFRTAGIQLATHFSYDPSFLAPFNTEYNTHYMNLLYAPRKALSLMLCAEVFRQIPLYADFGNYPANSSFGPFRVSYEEDLAELVTPEKFIYTNHTSTMPPAPEKLTLIAGWGNSPMVKYDGTGAYFLDKLGPDTWMLEIYPDAVQVYNPFGGNSLDKRVAEINLSTHRITLSLPDLGSTYEILSFTPSGSTLQKSTSGDIFLVPGKHIVTAMDQISFNDAGPSGDLPEWKGITEKLKHTAVLHQPVREWSADQDLTLQALIASNKKIDSVFVIYHQESNPTSTYKIKMESNSNSLYSGTIPAVDLGKGNFTYRISVFHGANKFDWPMVDGATPDAPGTIALQIVEPSSSILLFDASQDSSRLNREWLPGSRLIPANDQSAGGLYLKVNGLVKTDEEYLDGPLIADYSMRHYFGDLIIGRNKDLLNKKLLVINATSIAQTFPIQVSLVMKDGSAFGGLVVLNPDDQIHRLKLDQLKRVRPVILPRPYPTFLPYYSDAGNAVSLDLRQVESLQISVGPGIPREDWGRVYELVIGIVYLE